MTRTIALSLAFVLSLAACASERGDGEASDPLLPADAGCPACCAQSTAPVESCADAPQSPEPVVRFARRHEAWTLADMFKQVTATTGQQILYDDTIPALKATLFVCGVSEIKESDLFEFLQALLSYVKLTLVPVGPRAGESKPAWFVTSTATIPGRPPFIEESDLLRYADREGLYLVTTLSLRETVDVDRARDALSLLSTKSDGIGRIRETGPGGRTLIVGDFAPVAALMKRVIDRINANAPPAPAPAQSDG